ncbi:E3 ubiquitin-protein ligase TRAIP [Armadillidium nasatum]|uniref:E3 ubiquitin-protein ligase TRAIP n=1 Tax=Armadillidium nasatum TaxID=96803 RepID=A0A5N5TED5_9CRUS|nr:E3 ubiquitin-protein ligase TRAIP [Armadillidium nasatum]
MMLLLSHVDTHFTHIVCRSGLRTQKSCPTCRQRATHKHMQKLFFDAIENDTSQIDPEALQNQIDSLKFQVVEKQQLMINLNEENDKLERQNKGLRVKTFLDDNSTEIENTIESNCSNANSLESIRNLATISCVLKSRVNKLLEEKKKCVDENHSILASYKETKRILHKYEEEIVRLKNEIQMLSDDNKSLERENKSWKERNAALQESLISPSADAKNSLIQRLLTESPIPLELNKKKRSMATHDDIVDLTPEIFRKVSRTSSKEDVSKKNSESSQNDASPYLQIKSASIAALNLPTRTADMLKNGTNSKTHSFAGLAKAKSWSAVSSFPNDDVGYDGLGGHHKVDHFPDPNKAKILPVKKKKQPLPKVNSRGVSKIHSNTLKNFFKDPFSNQ